MMTDAQIIENARMGDRSAFGQLVSRYQERLFHSMIQVTGSPVDAEDIVQEAFIRAMTKLSSFRAECQFFTWLYRIAFNVALNHRRGRRQEVSVETSSEIRRIEPEDRIELPDERIQRQERSVRVRLALDQLTLEHRTILVLREMNDCSYDEISEILRISVGTVRSRLSRARAAMRRQLRRMERQSGDRLASVPSAGRASGQSKFDSVCAMVSA